MTTIPDLEYTRPPIDSEILEVMLDRLYHIVPMTRSVADPDTDEETRQECLAKIYEVTLLVGKSLMLIRKGVDGMDQQIKNLIACVEQRNCVSLN